MDDIVHDEPGEAAADKGRVSLDGPDGVSVLMTPDAAAETSDRLLVAAADAQGQIAAEQRKSDRQITGH